VYKFNRSLEICLLCKLIIAHLNPVAQGGVKVKLAAQVMRHTVAASLCSLVSAGKKYFMAFMYDGLL
jgi:hypothetical protein